MTSLSIELAKTKLMEAEEVKKAAVAKMNHRNRGMKTISNPTAGLARSERHDNITQIVQDGGFTADVAPAKGNEDLVPQADFADTYTKKMPHGQTGGTGSNGENQKSPKAVGTTSMKPNQTTKLQQVGTKIQRTEDDGNQNIFSIPQADFADEYTKKMQHGRAGGTTDEDTGGAAEPGKRSFKKMDGGPTRAGGKRTAKTSGDAVGAKDKDSQKVTQVEGPGTESSPSDAMTWGSADYKRETHGSHNVVESGVVVTLNGKKKATFEVVSHSVLNKMAESYQSFGYDVEFTRTDAAWKQDRQFLRLLRESIHAKYNHAPNIASQLRKAAMQRFGQLCRESFNSLYENRQDFVNTMGSAYKKIEAIAEDKYVDGLEFFNCTARLVVEGDVVDLEIVTQATDSNMACRQIRNTLHEQYGFGVDVKHIFVDGQKFTMDSIVEYKSSVKAKKKKAKEA